MMEIVISQNENQNITIENQSTQNININQEENQNINIQNKSPQELDIEQVKNQTILIDGGGNVYGITDVLVNGVSVVSNNIAYVIVPTKTSELENDSGFITHETDPTVPYYIKQISLSDINSWNNKQDLLVSGSNIKTINNISLLGNGNINVGSANYTAGNGINIDSENVISNTITSYNDLNNLPTIPTTTSELTNDSGYVTSSNLSLVAFTGSYDDLIDEPTVPTTTSELVNDSGFIDKDVNDLTYYTLTSNLSAVATSGDYNDLSNTPTIPTIPTNISSFTNDVGYITSSDFGNFSTAGTIKSANGLMINSVTGNPYAKTYNYSEYTSHTNEVFIGKGTLENALTGKGYINAIKTINSNSLIGSGNLLVSNIVETGSNANGEYIKFDNDYMICFNTVTFNSISITGSFESIYYANTGNITFPAQYSVAPNVMVSSLNIAGGGFSFYGTTTTEFSGFIWKIASATTNVNLQYLSIGKWR